MMATHYFFTFNLHLFCYSVVMMFILTVKQVGKFQPKLASRPKGGKAKSVSFALPNASETTSPS